ncbi:hypothetical protein WJX74_004514 [Apatococcus lobatus]|uniref:Uncharacterized protein n=1 Tax=Apatococcus lobatus TaxID=904363 RepID=A0AAW1QCA6_9CHLO
MRRSELFILWVKFARDQLFNDAEANIAAVRKVIAKEPVKGTAEIIRLLAFLTGQALTRKQAAKARKKHEPSTSSDTTAD